MKRSKERPVAEEKEAEEKPESVELKKESVFEENAEIVKNDSVFRNIVVSIESSWTKLDDHKKTAGLDAFEDLIEKIKAYHNSYTKLKGTTKFKLSPSAGIEAVKRYQGDVTEADRIEHILHNSFLDSVNILARFMKKAGLDISWYSDQEIYDRDYDTMRTKVKHWMFRVFAERET